MLAVYLDSEELIINDAGMPFLTVRSFTSRVNKYADLKVAQPSPDSTFLMLFTVLNAKKT